MSAPSSPVPQAGNVLNIISAFENHTVRTNDAGTSLRRTKSMHNLRQPKKPTRRENDVNLELVQIEQEIQHLEKKLLNSYKTYAKDKHVYYQNQVAFLLLDLINVDCKSHKETDTKAELAEIVKKLNKKLNALLPSSDAPARYKSHPPVSKPKAAPVSRKSSNEVKAKSFSQGKPPGEEQPAVVNSKEDASEIDDDEEEEDERVCVKDLKAIFERNTNPSEGRVDFGKTLGRSKSFSSMTHAIYTENGRSDFRNKKTSLSSADDGALNGVGLNNVDGNSDDGELDIKGEDDKRSDDEIDIDDEDRDDDSKSSNDDDSDELSD